MSTQVIKILNERFLSDDIITDEFIEECNQQLQQELFALPFNTYEVANLDGWKLYSSDSLKRKFSESMYKVSRTKPIAKEIEDLVYKNTIVPCWINKGIFRLAIFKIFAPTGSKTVLGFYIARHDQIYLLMDNSMSFGFASNIKLANLLIHESMHMAATHMKGRFLSLFNNEITEFYKAMAEHIFKTKGDITKEAKILTNFLFKKFEFSKEHNVRAFTNLYFKLMDKLFRKRSMLDDGEFDQVLTDYVNFVRLYFRDINRFVKSLRSNSHIYRGLLIGYEKGLKVRNNVSLCIQELFFPSEIICMYSELCGKGQLSKIYRAFHSI